MPKNLTVADVNGMSEEEFITEFGTVYEHSPWIAELGARRRPFSSVAHLTSSLAEIVRKAEPTKRMSLIQAHPELAGKLALTGQLTNESANEQRGAGLDHCTAQELEQLQNLNGRYQSQFGFPFVVAVKGHTRQSIIEAMVSRLNNDPVAEENECISQIITIAGYRVATKMDGSGDAD